MVKPISAIGWGQEYVLNPWMISALMIHRVRVRDVVSYPEVDHPVVQPGVLVHSSAFNPEKEMCKKFKNQDQKIVGPQNH